MGFPIDVYHEKTDKEVVGFITKLEGGCIFIKRLTDLRVSDTSIIIDLALRIVKYQDLFDIDMVLITLILVLVYISQIVSVLSG